MRIYTRNCFMLLLSIVFCQGVKAELPSQTERLYSLSKIWQELNYTFADLQRYNAVNVDSLYMEYLPLVAQVEDEYDYHQLLSAFLANFREGHTRIIPPSDAPFDYPKLDIECLDDILYVADTSEKLSAQIPRLSRILKVNGQDVKTYLTDSVAPYISATTDRWRMDKAATQLLYGKPETNVNVTLLTPEGKELDLTLNRDGRNDSTAMQHSLPTMEFDWLNDSILLMSFNTCRDVKGARETFLSHLNDVTSAKGIIIDVRKNRGGTEEAWYLPAFLMLNKDTIAYQGHDIMRTTSPSESANPEEPSFNNGTYELVHHPYPYTNGIPQEYRINTPVIILSGKYTGSAAEFFVQLMRENHPDLKVIGEPSVGSSSIPAFVTLPDDYTLMIAKGIYCDRDGNLIGHTGIIPDETIYLTFEEILKGYDPVLERAIELLSI